MSSTVHYRLWVSTEASSFLSRPTGFSNSPEEALAYGDVDGPAAAVARQMFRYDSIGESYSPWYGDGRLAAEGLFGGSGDGALAMGFLRPQSIASRYERAEFGAIQAGGAVTLALGAHRIEAGASVERETYRRYTLLGARLAAFVDDADGPEFYWFDGYPDGITSLAQFPYAALRNWISFVGYSHDGLRKSDPGVDAESLHAYSMATSPLPGRVDVAPYRPMTAAAYVQDEVAFGPADLRLGLRIEAYDPNALLPLDIYTPAFPVVRARDLASVPGGIDDDAVVLYEGDTAVGFRDLDGVYYDARGVETDDADLFQFALYRVTDGPVDPLFRDAPISVRVEPRFAATVHATAHARVHVSYDRLSRRPDRSTYVPFVAYLLGGEDGRLPSEVATNPLLRVTTVDAYRVGAEIDARPGLTVSAAAVRRETSAPDAELAMNALDLGVVWVPATWAGLRAGYTLASVDASAVRDDPSRYSRFNVSNDLLATDIRHEIDVVAEARVPTRAGPLLGGFGAGLSLSAQSGAPYTAILPGSAFYDGIVLMVEGDPDSQQLPWTAQFDLRLDKTVWLAGSAVEAFVWVENLLDADNVLAVYAATGEPDDDGFDSSFMPWLERGFLYDATVGGPVAVGGRRRTSSPYTYGQPRQIRLGLRLTL